jgi:hypothetical protein
MRKSARHNALAPETSYYPDLTFRALSSHALSRLGGEQERSAGYDF